MKYTNFQDVALTREQIRDCTKLVTINYDKMPYKKITKGQYELYCPYCQTYQRITTNELRDIQQSKQCPICKSRYRSTTTQDHFILKDYVYISGYGYMFMSEWKFGEPIKLLKYEQMAAFFDKTYIKYGYYLGNFGRGIYYNGENANSSYRSSYSENYLRNMYNYYNSSWTYRFGSKKVKRTWLMTHCGYITKSNQIKMIADNDIPADVIPSIKLFDLNTLEEVTKYEKYMLDNHWEANEVLERKDYQFNKYYLDYLSRNNISLQSYIHYADKLKKLNIKLDKPKDFDVREEIIDEMYEKHMNREVNVKINERYNSLPKYENGNITIQPFKSKEEMTKCSKELHNCVGRMYVDRYADMKTDVYHLDVDGKMTIAIEILNKALNQARSDSNGKCPDKLLAHIKSFCQMNGFSYQGY